MLSEGLERYPVELFATFGRYLPGFHVLAECGLAGLQREVSVVDFHRVYSLPVAFLRKKSPLDVRRLRLLPPYREHLSQAFARFFMQMGLPVVIPPFR